MKSVWKLIQQFRNSSTQWWHNSYLLDWFLPLIILAITIGVTESITPFRRYLPSNDSMVSYPRVDDIVPSNF